MYLMWTEQPEQITRCSQEQWPCDWRLLFTTSEMGT